MSPRRRPAPLPPGEPDGASTDAPEDGIADELTGDGSPVATPDLSSLAIAGVTRRHLGFLAGALVSAWILIVFARQVGEASAASARVDALRDANVALAGQLSALEREAELIQRQAWVEQQARGYRLGSGAEIPFALGDAEPLPADAPGSAAVRLGAGPGSQSPLETWLSLLFGPSR